MAQTAAAPDNLFEQAFAKRRAPSVQQIALPTSLDAREVGLINAQIRSDGVWLSREALTSVLNRVLQPSGLSALAGAEPAGPWISAQALNKLGIEAIYSAQSITLELKVPMQLRATRLLSLDARSGASQNKAQDSVLRPERWSLIANTRWVWLESRADQAQITSLRAYLDAAQRMGDWVLEAAGSVPVGQTGAVATRDMTRLVRDWPAQAIRLTAGDLNSSARPGLASLPLGGLQVSRRFSLNPVLNALSQPSQRVVLPQGAQIDVRANGFVSRSLQLAPGVYELRDIPVFSGANEVELQIVEPGGRSSVRRFDYFYDSALLAPGLFEFDVAIGAPSQAAARGLSYATNQSVAALSGRYGLNAQLSWGAAAQWRKSTLGGVRVIQTDALWAMPWGTVQAYLTRNQHPGFSGHSASVQWSAQSSTMRERKPGQWSWAAVLQSTVHSAGHAALSSDTGSSGARDHGARVSALVPGGLTASMSASRRTGNLPTDQARTLGLSLRKALDKQWSLEAQVNQQRDALGSRQQFNLSLRYAAQARADGIAARSSLSYQSAQQRWQWDAEASGLGTVAGAEAPWRVLASTARSATVQDHSVRAAVQTSRAELAGYINDSRRLDGVLGQSRLTEFSLASGLIVTPSGWALTRPVSDSAALVVPRAGYERLSIYIDPSLDRSAASSDRWGPPVLGDLNAYNPREIQLDVSNLPPGRSLGIDRPTLEPAYRSVITVPLGSNANVQLSGSVLNAQGQPAALLALRLAPFGKGDPVDLFTSRRGRFTSPPLPPGRYQLMIPGDAKALKQWTIEPEQAGIVDIGSIQLAAEAP
jgi:outer membrane usher protein